MKLPWAALNNENFRCFVSRSWQVAWPMTLIMLFDFMVGLTDVFVAGRVGKDVQAAYVFVVRINFFIIIVANALTVGTVSVVSKLFSSGDRDELGTAVFSALTATSVAGAVFAGAGIVGAPFLIGILNIPAEIKPYCVPLIRIYSAGMFFQYLLITANGVLRSCNMIRDSLKTMTIVCLLNVGLNFLFVFATPLRFRGIALATATAVLIGSMLNLRLVGRLVGRRRFYSASVMKKVLKIGWPMAALQILWQLGSILLFFILSALPENRVEIIAAFGVGMQIESLIYLPAYAFSLSNGVIVGNLLGEKKGEEAYRSGIVTALVGVSAILILTATVMVNARWITSLLSTNPVVTRESVKYIYIALISEPFMAWGIILGGGLNGAGATRSVMVRVAGSIWLVRLPLAFLLVVVFGFGAASVWWSMNISQFVQTFLLYRRYSRKDWLAVSS
jgi:multidrug resistance protein, MATE family